MNESSTAKSIRESAEAGNKQGNETSLRKMLNGLPAEKTDGVFAHKQATRFAWDFPALFVRIAEMQEVLAEVVSTLVNQGGLPLSDKAKDWATRMGRNLHHYNPKK
jgi:hypothetical protein